MAKIKSKDYDYWSFEKMESFTYYDTGPLLTGSRSEQITSDGIANNQQNPATTSTTTTTITTTIIFGV